MPSIVIRYLILFRCTMQPYFLFVVFVNFFHVFLYRVRWRLVCVCVCVLPFFVLSPLWNNSIMLLSSVAIVRHNDRVYYLYSLISLSPSYRSPFAQLHIRRLAMFAVLKFPFVHSHHGRECFTSTHELSTYNVWLRSAFSLQYEPSRHTQHNALLLLLFSK